MSIVQRKDFGTLDNGVFAKIELDVLLLIFVILLQEHGLALGVTRGRVASVVQCASGVSPRSAGPLAENVIADT